MRHSDAENKNLWVETMEKLEMLNKAIWQQTLDKIVEPVCVKFEEPSAKKLGLVLVEFRCHEWLRPVLWNLAWLYSDSGCSLTVVCGPTNSKLVMDIVSTFANVRILELQSKACCTIDDYNHMMTQSTFYEMLSPCQNILVLQTDTLSRKQVTDEMLSYTYVGAPWAGLQKCGPSNSVVGNGGYSLRSVPDMIQICNTFTYDPVEDHAEDLFFAKHTKNPAPTALASAFSVEHVPHPYPCGMHQAWRFHSTDLVRHWLKAIPGLPPPERICSTFIGGQLL
jgi:hypothetical protein